MTLPQRLPDAEARHSAATDFSRNWVVLAGAGTGKTSLLIERILNAVGSDTAELDRIAAITFTEKAAGEMRQRLAAGLERLRALASREATADSGTSEADRAYRHLRDSLGIDDEDVARRALAALEQLDRATIQTIHAFCADLLRRYPWDADVDPAFSVDTGEHFATLFRSFWEREVTEVLSTAGSESANWIDALRCGSMSELRDLARELAGFQIPAEFLEPEPAVPDSHEALDSWIRDLCLRLEVVKTDGIKRGKWLDFVCSAGLDTLRRFLDQGPEAARAFLLEQPELLQQLDAGFRGLNKGTQGLERRATEDTAKRASLLLKALRNLDDRALHTMATALAPLAMRFRETYLKAGFVGFDGLLVFARTLLRDNRHVRQAFARRYRLLLVDEFQDTDPVQYEIVLFLAAAEGAAGVDPFEMELEQGRLFVVGDAKQSIYRFRGADYAAYRRAIARIVERGGAELHLTANFRTVGAVLHPVNAIFDVGSSVWEASDYQPPYEAIQPVRADSERTAGVEIWALDDDVPLSALQRREAEGRILAAELIRQKQNGQLGSFREVTCLFRALTNITPYLRALREAGIPFVVDGGRELLTRPEVTQWMATLRAVSHPGNAPALLAFLRCPAGAVSDAELAAYADQGGRWDWRIATVDGQQFPRIAAAFALVREMAEETRDEPVDGTARKILRRSLLLPLGAAAFEGAQRVANLQKLSAAAGELARDGRLSLEDVVEALEEGRLADIETDRPLADERADAVRITSIHRMKGLENHWVILPDLAGDDGKGRHVPQWAGAVFSKGNASRLGLSSHPLMNGYRIASSLESRFHEEAEEVRVLYVALTRARDRLTLIDGSRAARHSTPRKRVAALAAWGYDIGSPANDGELLADGRVMIRRVRVGEREAIRLEPKALDAVGAEARYRAAWEKLRERAQPRMLAPSGLRETHRSPAVGDDDENVPRNAGDLGRAVGIALHGALEVWDGAADSFGNVLRGAAAAAAAETGVAVQQILDEANPIAQGFLASPLADRFRQAEILGREVSMLGFRDGRATRGNIDLLYRTPDGEVVVADFKTDRESDVAALAEKYRAQLFEYAFSVEKAMALPSPPRTELWLLRHGLVVTI